jgi:hypothetical protein
MLRHFLGTQTNHYQMDRVLEVRDATTTFAVGRRVAFPVAFVAPMHRALRGPERPGAKALLHTD